MDSNAIKLMSLRRDGECVCGAYVPRGTEAGWHLQLRIVICAACLKLEPVSARPVDVGV